MKTVLAIAARELRAWFGLPLGALLLAATQFLMAWQFLVQLDRYIELQPRLVSTDGAPGVTDLVVAPFLGQAAFLLLLLAPLVAMRCFAEERRQGSLAMLLAAPVRPTALLVGKWLAVLAVLAVPVALAAGMVLSLRLGTPLDAGKLWLGLLGLALCAALLAAIGVACSALNSHPLAAAALALGLGLLLWMVDQSARERGVVDELINWIALPSHLNRLLSAELSLFALSYFVLGTLAALRIAHWALQRLRWRG